MKGLNLKNKIVVCLVAIITALLCVMVSLNEKTNKKAYAASTLFTATTSNGEQRFSAKFGGDILFSAEKVLVDVDGDYKTNPDGNEDNVLYQRTETSAAYGEERYFYNYYYNNGTVDGDKKYVIDNGEFVMMENEVTESGKYYYHQDQKLAEVVLISLGQYIYNIDADGNESINQAESGKDESHLKMAGITSLQVKIYKNGKEIKDLPPIRNVDIYLDFMYIIPQTTESEGYYQFEFSYLANTRSYTETFEFYMINRTSYNGLIKYTGSNNEYFVQPTLGWVETSGFKTKTSETRYHSGKDGLTTSTISYPTITYDYSKFSFSYKHTANGIITDYNFKYNYTTNATGEIIGSLDYTITSGNKTSTITKTLKYENNVRKLVTIVLVDPGLYEFNYNYIYDGYNATSAPNINLDLQKINNLYIHGADLVYSKYNYQSAEMRYLTLSTNEKDKVDLIVPNAIASDGSDGKNIENYKNSAIGFIYEVDNSSSARVGDVVMSKSKDTLLNATLKSINTLDVDGSNDYEYLTSDEGDAITEEFSKYIDGDDFDTENLSEVLNEINYQKTNQGSLWFTMNDSYKDSFYFYNTEKFTGSNLFTEVKDATGKVTGYKTTKNTINSETTFNKIGYYLVFLKIQPLGTNTESDCYYQIFAFEYSTSTVNIEVLTIASEGKPSVFVGANKFTRENVKATWAQPGVFERKLEAKYYVTTNASDNINTILEKNDSAELVSGVTEMGGIVAEGSYMKFLIEIKSEGESATYKIFTIDRQAISGVSGYVVARKYAGTSYYYAYDLDKYGETKKLDNNITDSYATLDWANKESGANIEVTYTWTSFVKETSITPNFKDVQENKSAIITNYQLGETDGDFAFTKAVNISYLQSSSVLVDEGIYIFTLTDEAGNSCKYALVIDRTENFFYVYETPDNKTNDGEFFASGSSLLYADKVNYDIAEYKAINLNVNNPTEGSKKEDLLNFLKAVNGVDGATLKDYKYFGGNDSANNLKKIFYYDSTVAGGAYYLTVKNTNIDVYNDVNEQFNGFGTNGTINIDDREGVISTIRNLYVKGENHKNSSTYKEYDDTKSKLTVEINTDNAKGTVYYNSTMTGIPSDGDKLTTGGTLTNSHATNAEHVMFVFNTGAGGDYEVDKVTYTYYALGNSYNNDNYYFYHKAEGPVTIFENGQVVASTGATKVGDKVYIKFGKSASTPAGLYAVTRTYVNMPVESNDKAELTYHFIVDRNGIIDNNIGTNISIELLENEETFNDFTMASTNTSTLNKPEDGFVNKPFPIYLSTTKLPATLNIPTGKYLQFADGELTNTTADYYAGQLNVSIYFIDKYSQLTEQADGTELLYKGDVEQNENGFFTIDMYGNNCKIESYSKFFQVQSNQNRDMGNWIYLPGIYAIVIEDNVEYQTNGNVHQKIIGLEIQKGVAPEVDIATGFDKDDLQKQRANAFSNTDYQYTITTSKEFVSVTLPAYKDNETKKPQVDLKYLEVYRYIDGVLDNNGTIYYPYEQKIGTDITVDSGAIKLKDGATTIYLDTLLKDAGGYIINLDKEISYLVTVRYKLYSNNNVYNKDRYINCYKYLDDSRNDFVKWYETTYKIIIDRQAPTNNINNLVKGNSELNITQDYLAEEYNRQHEIEEMFVRDSHVEGNDIYFTAQYNKYYNEKENFNDNASYIYALKVNSKTPFDKTDIVKVLYKEINPTESGFALSLPVVEANYTNQKDITNLNTNSTYSSIFGVNADNNYYEVVEIDAAGNATQYVVYYSDAEEQLEMSLNIKKAGEQNLGLTTIKFDGKDKHLPVLEIVDESSNITNGENYFFKIELTKNGSVINTTYTNFKTNFDDVVKNIVGKLQSKGTYSLSVTARNNNLNSITIIKYAYEESVALKAQNIIDITNKTLNLQGANRVIDGVPFYVDKITITSGESENVYIASIRNNGNIRYERSDVNETIKLSWGQDDNITYKIAIEDLFGNKDIAYFNTVTGFEGFYKVSFAEPSGYYMDDEGVYYGYTDAVLKYDKTISNNFNITLNGKLIDAGAYNTNKIVVEDGIIKFTAIDNEIRDYKITFIESETTGASFNIVIDMQTPIVRLVDINTYENKSMTIGVNIADQNLNLFLPEKVISGFMNLSWQQVEKDYFTYTYILRELNSNTQKDLTGLYEPIAEGGIYQFIVKIHSAEGVYIGNKVYAFEVADNNELLYYVKDSEGKAIASNSTFKTTDLDTANFNSWLSSGRSVPSTNLPLYIIKAVEDVDPFTVVTHEDLVINNINTDRYVYKFSGNTFYMYEIETATHSQYFAVLVVKAKNLLVKDVEARIGGSGVNGISINHANTSLTIVSEDKEQVNLYASTESGDGILAKNEILLDVYYNSSKEIVRTIKAGQSGKIDYEIFGNGLYSFMFRDLAGNVHLFGENEKVNITILREVVLFVNGKVPVENAYYNNPVDVRIFSSSQYDVGSINTTVKRNGEIYPIDSNYAFVLSEYGSYKITINAVVAEQKLTKVLNFTIINEKEVRSGIDLTNLNTYEIQKVTNSKGKDVTSTFNKIFNTGSNSMFINYDKIFAYANELNLSTGKQTFEITYVVTDPDYPTRIETFKFTLNNEVPKIECSLAPGETTTKDFSITFNPGILYEQIGESYLMINDEIVAYINEFSMQNIQTISKSFKEDGDGDYYIQLVSSSGNVWLSYKATIKEPLNFWAIIIIIVVVVVVVGLTVTIIVLRNKMRIR